MDESKVFLYVKKADVVDLLCQQLTPRRCYRYGCQITHFRRPEGFERLFPKNMRFPKSDVSSVCSSTTISLKCPFTSSSASQHIILNMYGIQFSFESKSI